MTKNKELAVRLTFKDNATKALNAFERRVQKSSNYIRKNWLAVSAGALAAVYALRKLADASGQVFSSLTTVSGQFEKWQIQMEAFTTSTEQAKEKLGELIDFSVKTPFTPEEVLNVSSLLLPLEQAGYKLKDLLQIAGNIAATYPMTFQEAALNLNKSLSAGMGSARLFYEQGVRSHMQAISGISDLTKVKQKELMKVFESIYLDSDSPLSRGIEKLSLSYSGLVSTVQGEWMLLKEKTAAPMFEEHKKDLRALLWLIRDSKEAGGEYNEVVDDLSVFFKEAYSGGRDLMASLLVGGGQLIDVWNEAHLMIMGAYGALVKLGEWQNKLYANSYKGIIGITPWSKKSVAEAKQNIALLQEEWNRLAGEVADLEVRAGKDWSTKVEAMIKKFNAAIDAQRSALGEEGQGAPEEEERRRLGIISDVRKEFEEKYQDMINDTTAGKIANLDKEYQKYAEHVQEKSRLDEWYAAEYDKITKKSESANTMMEEFTKQAARNMQNAMTDFFGSARTGFDSLEDVVADFGDTVLKMIDNILATILLTKALTAVAGSDKKIWGIDVGKILDSFHSGGMVNKYHRGGMIAPIIAHQGLAPDEVPIIAQTGEAVLSRRGVAAVGGSNGVRALNSGGGGGMTVNITVPMAVQAFDAADIMRNAKAIGAAVSQEVANNGSLRTVLQKYT